MDFYVSDRRPLRGLLSLGVSKQDLMPKARDEAELARRPQGLAGWRAVGALPGGRPGAADDPQLI